MFGIKSKKNKQTALELEIEDLIGVMSTICPVDYKENDTELDREISTVLNEMRQESPGSEEYIVLVDILDKLYKAKANDKSQLNMYSEMNENLEKLQKIKEDKNVQKQFPWKEVVVGMFGLAQILVIIKYEEVNVITGKALSFVSKGRV